MSTRDIPQHESWTPDQPSSVPLVPWTASEGYKEFLIELSIKESGGVQND